MSHVFVVGGGRSYYNAVSSFGAYKDKLNEKSSPQVLRDEFCFFLFTGGCDVGPQVYNEEHCAGTWFHTSRDVEEVYYFHIAKACRIPMVGICRGLQFLHVMHGGKLFQDVNNHNGISHRMMTSDSEIVHVNSLHHQMLDWDSLPANENGKLLGWSEIPMASYYRGRPTPPNYEAEVAFYPSTCSFGVQYHPESMSDTSRGALYFKEMIRKLVLNHKMTITK